MFIAVMGFDNVCGQILIFFQAASLIVFRREQIYRKSTGATFDTVITMWAIGEIPTATITQLDKLVIQLHIHLSSWIGNEVGGHTVRQITAVMLGSEKQMNAL
jgi:hypothetical protein